MSFLDSSLPIATCKAKDCSGCTVADQVHCRFRPAELVHFLVICMPTFLVGGAAVLTAGWTPFLIWQAVVFGFFGLVEIRVMYSGSEAVELRNKTTRPVNIRNLAWESQSRTQFSSHLQLWRAFCSHIGLNRRSG